MRKYIHFISNVKALLSDRYFIVFNWISKILNCDELDSWKPKIRLIYLPNKIIPQLIHTDSPYWSLSWGKWNTFPYPKMLKILIYTCYYSAFNMRTQEWHYLFNHQITSNKYLTLNLTAVLSFKSTSWQYSLQALDCFTLQVLVLWRILHYLYCTS